MTIRKQILPAVLILSMSIFLTGGGLRNQQTAGELFEKALYIEEGQGDLQRAVGLYQEIVKVFPENREIAAKALLHIGICYEKLGDAEARKAYNRLLKDYGDQIQPAKEARVRLASLEAPAGAARAEGADYQRRGFTFKKIDFEEIGKSHQARLSPNGDKLLYIGVQEKDPRYSICVMDLVSGKSHSLLEGVDFGSSIIFEWSPNGNKIVFKHGRGELRLIDAKGGKPESLWSAEDPAASVFPLDWSGQTHEILIALVNREEKSVCLATIPDTGGKAQTVVKGDPIELADLGHFSPDGKYVVGFRKKDNNMEICVWPAGGGEEIRVTRHPADDIYPFWSPDGNHIVFISDRSKTVDLWAVPMAGSRPADDPVRIHADVGKSKIPSDFTKSGQLTFYATNRAGRPSDLFILPIDPNEGTAEGPFRPFSKFPAQASFPRWSPDGLRIAYTSRKGNLQLPNVFVSTEGDGDDLEISARGHFIGNVEWTRDGEYLLFPGWNNEDGRVGIFRISLADGAIEPVHVLGERYGSNFKGAFINIRWLPLMGKYMFGRLLGDEKQDIYTMDPNSGKIELAAAGIKSSGWCLPSPEGRQAICIDFQNKNINLLAFEDMKYTFLCKLPPEGWPAFSWAPDGQRFVWNEKNQLKMFTVLDGSAKILAALDGDKKIVGGLDGTPNTAWSPDGSQAAFIVRDATKDGETPDELWIVEVKDGMSKKIAAAPSTHPQISTVSWHPSGKMILSHGDSAEKKVTYEHWIMENLLPEKRK